MWLGCHMARASGDVRKDDQNGSKEERTSPWETEWKIDQE